NLDGKQMGGERLRRAAHGIDDLVIQAGTCLLLLPLAQHVQQGRELRRERGLYGAIKRSLGSILDGKHIDNEPTRCRTPRGCTPWSTVITKYLASTDIEAVGCHQAGDKGKFAKQIVGCQQHLGTGGAAWYHAYLHGMLVVDSSQEQHMGGNLRCRIQRKIIGIELGK